MEIKFRAWDGKEMINPYCVRDGKACIIRACDISEPVITGLDGCDYYKNWDIEVTTDYPLMQFSGIYDRNDNEIYEGDILSDEDGDISIVKFEEGVFGTCNTYALCSYPYDMEVIGNIYENPDLKP